MTSYLKRCLIPLFIILLFLPACSSTPETTTEEKPQDHSLAYADQIKAVERELLPSRVIAGDEGKKHTLAERMEHYKVPGVSIAIIEDNSLAWAKGYGVCKAGTDEQVDTETRFQAASISKGVAAFGALLLVQNGKLDLDTDVNKYLTRWHLPPLEGNKTPVTAKMLMSHTAGTTVHGFPGYAMGDKLPTIEQVLDGTEPANTDPVRITTAPGTEWSYSGGGYTILQLLMEEVSGQPFADYMQSAVLDPLKMTRSTFEHIPADSPNVADAHNGSGEPGVGGWHVYPEMAAAGLWTTPSDLARYLIAIQTADLDNKADPLSAESASLMTTPVKDDYGLGLGVSEQDGEPVISHGGGNWGYRCFFKVWPERDLGIVVMTNGDNGSELYPEIVDAFARHNELPATEQKVFEVDTSVDPATYPDFAGSYYVKQFDITFKIILIDGTLYMERDATTPRQQLYPKSANRYFTLEEGAEYEFKRGESGKVTGLTIIFRGREIPAVRQQ